jgi:hypothetical protein
MVEELHNRKLNLMRSHRYVAIELGGFSRGIHKCRITKKGDFPVLYCTVAGSGTSRTYVRENYVSDWEQSGHENEAESRHATANVCIHLDTLLLVQEDNLWLGCGALAHRRNDRRLLL